MKTFGHLFKMGIKERIINALEGKIDYSEEYFKIVMANPMTNMTWNEFFDKCKIPKDKRSNFLAESILNGYQRLMMEEAR